MPCTVQGATLVGVEAIPVGVEVDLLRRLPAVVVVGLPAPSVRESADRVRSAILGAGYEFPKQRVVISLSPADLRKDGTGFDLPIAVGILAAAGRVPEDRAREFLMVGELSLSGELRPVRGALAFADLAKKLSLRGIIVPERCAQEAALMDGIEVRAAPHLSAVVEFLCGRRDLPPRSEMIAPFPTSTMDLKDVVGQPTARLALEVAAAGGHNLLMEGPPGCGKSMLASRLPSILPPLTVDEALECTRIQSVAGLRSPEGGLASNRPFRAPHHSISLAGLVGGATLRPGEVSLAHHGVLFLDEFPEFPRNIREALRAPLEDRQLVISRAEGQVCFPARFMLVAASNPCPCGYLGHPTRPCICSPTLRERYRSRLSGPLIDRIDLRVQLLPTSPHDLLQDHAGETSQTVRKRVVEARERQQARYAGLICSNAELPAEQVLSACNSHPLALRLLQKHLEDGAYSARVGRRLLKVARTLADLEGAERVGLGHVRLAIDLRSDVEDQPCAS